MEHPMQTESSTEIAERVERPCVDPARVPFPPCDPDMACFAKAKLQGEPTFTLRAQDVTAPIAVLFWAKIQMKVRGFMDAGLTMEDAVQRMKTFYFLDDIDHDAYTDPKLDGAVWLADAMAAWPGVKKLAD